MHGRYKGKNAWLSRSSLEFRVKYYLPLRVEEGYKL